MTETSQFIGLWANSEWTLLLTNSSAEIFWKTKNCKATGFWSIGNKILTLRYSLQNSYTSLEWQGEILEATENYIKVKDISNEFGKIEILEKQKPISKIQQVIDKHKDDLLKAYIYSIFISVLLGSVIRFIINPAIPTWLVYLAVFFGSLIFIKRYEQ